MKNCKEFPLLDRLKSHRGALTVLFLFTVAAFAGGLRGGFLNFDDNTLLVENPNGRGFGGASILWMFTTFHMGHYMPLTWLSYALDHALWGMNPVGYHAVNLFFHFLNVALFYLLARRVFDRVPGVPRPAPGGWDGPALSAALLYAVHPLRVESVVWITERRDVLSGFFLLLTLLAYWEAAPRGEKLGRRVVPLFALSLLCKAWGITLPVVLILIDRFLLNRWSWAWEKKKGPLWGLAAAGAVLAAAAQSSSNAVGSAFSAGGILRSVWQAAQGLWYYPLAHLWPLNLSPVNDFPVGGAWGRGAAALGGAIVLSVFLWRSRRRRPFLAAGLAAYAVLVAPVLGFFQSGFQFVADRYTYVSAWPLVLLAAGGAWRWAARESRRREILWALLGIAALLLTALSSRYARAWTDGESLWTWAVAARPESYTAQAGLGSYWIQRGQPEKALPCFERSVELNPRFAEGYLKEGEALELLGRKSETPPLYERARALNPGWSEPYLKLGDAYRESGDLYRAESLFRAAANLRKGNAEILCRLGVTLMAQGKWAEARGPLLQAVRANPGDPHAFNDLGIVHSNLGDPVSAEKSFLRAIERSPDFAEARVNYGFLLLRTGRTEDAEGQFRKALEEKKDFPEALAGLGYCEMAKGHGPESKALLEKSRRLKPALPQRGK
ncbi:MAG: tetratricopeptide repeat protein [Elusimicrobia bacterium]|nr:tetratricopeptide repeat protein [Elusimicrobiota bacterium]